MSLGMLIQPLVEQTTELLRDVGLIVLNIMDGICLLLCKVCNVCLEPKPCQVHTHLLGHDNRRTPKRHRNGRQRRVTTIPPVMDFASLFEEIEFTPLQDPCLERYTTSPPPELLPVVPGITVVNGYRCKADGCVYYCTSRKTIANHRLANLFFLPVDASCQPCQVQRLFTQVGYTTYFGVDHQNMELAGDLVGLQLKEQVHVSLHARQCSTSNVARNPSIRELSPWLRISRWHELAVNHIIPVGTPLDHVKQASVLLTPIGGEFNLDRLPLMVRAYLENAQTIISCVPYHLRRLVISLEDSPVATMGLNQLWVPSTLKKYCTLMTKLLITMVRSKDNSPVDDKPFVNVLGNLHSDLGDALDNKCTILMQLMRPTWQPDHPAVPWCEVDEWLACVRDNAKDTPFNRLRETMCLACTVLGDGLDIPRLVRIGPMACTIDGQAVTIDTLRNLVGVLLCKANKVMNNQLVLGLKTTWIRRVIAEGNIVDKANEDNIGYSFLSDACNEFQCHGQDLAIHLFSDRHTRGLFIKGIDNDRSIIWNQNVLAMWARAADRMHALLFLLMHFTAGGPPRGEEYRSYLIRNTEDFDRTFYWSGGTIMTFQRYHKGANARPPIKLIPRFLPQELNLLFIEYLLLVRPV